MLRAFRPAAQGLAARLSWDQDWGPFGQGCFPAGVREAVRVSCAVEVFPKFSNDKPVIVSAWRPTPLTPARRRDTCLDPASACSRSFGRRDPSRARLHRESAPIRLACAGRTANTFLRMPPYLRRPFSSGPRCHAPGRTPVTTRPIPARSGRTASGTRPAALARAITAPSCPWPISSANRPPRRNSRAMSGSSRR